MKKIVSVIIPIFNVENYLSECIESVIEQSYKNLEIILVNDGSTDNSLEICKKYASKDKRIKIIDQKNGGLSKARNSGIEIAKGEYFFFVDSDDYIHPQLIDKLVDAINTENDIDLAICNYSDKKVECKDGRIELWQQSDFWNNYYGSNYICCVVAWSKLYKKSLFDNKLRFPEKKLHEDEFILPDIIEKCRKIAFINSPLYFYRSRENSIMHSQNFSNYVDEFDAFVKRTNYFVRKNSFFFTGKALDSVLFELWEIFNNCEYSEYLNYKNKFKKMLKRISLNKISISTRMKIIFLLLNDKLYFKLVTLRRK